MKYELPSIELIVIEENNYLKFGEYLNDMQCDDTANKLRLDDLEHVKKLQQKNDKLKDNWNELKEYLEDKIYSIEPKGTGINYNCEYDSEEDYVMAMQEQSRLNTLKEILQKCREIIGDDK